MMIKDCLCFGIVSPSSGDMYLYPKRVNRGINYLVQRGHEVKLGEHALGRQGYVSADIKQRLDDIHKFVEDKTTDVIMASLGGYNCNQLLKDLNYNAISSSQKLFCGYSDFTAILLAVHSIAKIPVVYGPTFLVEICEYPQPYDYTEKYAWACITGQPIKYNPPDYNVCDYIDWAEEENKFPIRKNRYPSQCWKIVQEGKATGLTIGGNMQTILDMVGTQYLPLSMFDDRILFLEDAETKIAKIDGMIYTLRNRGVFERIAGLVVGRFLVDEFANNHLITVLRLAVNRNDIPILCNVDLGHIHPKISVPIGRNSTLILTDTIIWHVDGEGGDSN